MEEVERLLKLRVLPARSWVRRVIYRRWRLSFRGGRALNRSAKTDASFPVEVCIAASAVTLLVKTAIGGMVGGPSVV
jgi:hypothetical protein